MMDEVMRGRLNRFLVQISNDLDYRQVIVVLRTHCIFDENDAQDITNSAVHATDSDKRVALVTKLQQRGRNAYWLFCHAVKTRSPHLYDALHGISQDSSCVGVDEDLACSVCSGDLDKFAQQSCNACRGLMSYVNGIAGINEVVTCSEQIQAFIARCYTEVERLSSKLQERDVAEEHLRDRNCRDNVRIAEMEKRLEESQLKQQMADENRKQALMECERRENYLMHKLNTLREDYAALQKKSDLEMQDCVLSDRYVNAASIKSKDHEDCSKQLTDELHRSAQLTREIAKLKHFIAEHKCSVLDCSAEIGVQLHEPAEMDVKAVKAKENAHIDIHVELQDRANLMLEINKLAQKCRKFQIEKDAAEHIIQQFHCERQILLDQIKASDVQHRAAVLKHDELMETVCSQKNQLDQLSDKLSKESEELNNLKLSLKAKELEMEIALEEKWKITEAELVLKIRDLEQKIIVMSKVNELPMESLSISDAVHKPRKSEVLTLLLQGLLTSETIQFVDSKTDSNEREVCPMRPVSSISSETGKSDASMGVMEYVSSEYVQNALLPEASVSSPAVPPRESQFRGGKYELCPNKKDQDLCKTGDGSRMDHGFSSFSETKAIFQCSKMYIESELNCKTRYFKWSSCNFDTGSPVSAPLDTSMHALKVVTMVKVHYEDFGFQLEGGNQTGIFVKSVDNWSPAKKAGFQVGWRLLKVNNMVVADAAFCYVLEVLRFLRHDTAIEFLFEQVPYAQYKFLMTLAPHDKFYVRALVDYYARSQEELSFRKEDFLCVCDSFVAGEVGRPYRWKACLEDPRVVGLIPRQLCDTSTILHCHTESVDVDSGAPTQLKSKRKRSFVQRIKNHIVRSEKSCIIDVMDQVPLYEMLGDGAVFAEMLQE